MKLLLDTHILLWAAIGDTKLPAAAAQLIDDEANTFISVQRAYWN
ncbi:hypothetical protein [Pseudomonas syringae group genomosp. 3]